MPNRTIKISYVIIKLINFTYVRFRPSFAIGGTMKNSFVLLIAVVQFINFEVYAACSLQNSKHAEGDVLSAILRASTECPRDVRELKLKLEMDGLKTLPTMVANRGFHNPKLGSFSIFESAIGLSSLLNVKIQPEHLYFGHFTELSAHKEIVLDQVSSPNKLLIEVIAYDFSLKVYNFYELVGTNQGPQWFYRGNSYDAYADNKKLKIAERPQFGNVMRCSGCHNSGGPIMKELSSPHNDWWTKTQGLPLGGNKPSLELTQYMNNFIDASEFSKNVMKGIRLIEQKKISHTLSIKEKLRPLFCTTEINLKSDTQSFISSSNIITISSEVFIDPLLMKSKNLFMRKDQYTTALKKLGSRFPENNFLDAAHAFLAPVKSEINQLQVKQLIDSHIIDEEFALDVLSIDFKNPALSSLRCNLLKFIPESSNWKENFKKNLIEVNLPEAVELANKMVRIDGHLHRAQTSNYLKEKESSWVEQNAVTQEVIKLNGLRLSVFKDEISQNPKGQILEPGFRLIFPVMTSFNNSKILSY